MAIDLNSGSGAKPGSRTISEDINEAIDAALMERRAREPKRTYLGASILGSECGRYLCYEYAGTEPDEPLTAKQLRIFATGHGLEDAAVSLLDEDALSETFKGLARQWLTDSGFELKTRDSQGNQFGFSTLEGKIKGHIDAAILNVPPSIAKYFPSMPGGWEHKGLAQKWWNKVKKHGVKVSYPVYYGQMQTYMGYLDLWWFLFTATNKNTSEMHHEIVVFDHSCAQRLSDRGLEVVSNVDAGHLLDRCASNPDYYICKMCKFQKRCWSDD